MGRQKRIKRARRYVHAVQRVVIATEQRKKARGPQRIPPVSDDSLVVSEVGRRARASVQDMAPSQRWKAYRRVRETLLTLHFSWARQDH